jgi:hypothetical protein
MREDSLLLLAEQMSERRSGKDTQGLSRRPEIELSFFVE